MFKRMTSIWAFIFAVTMLAVAQPAPERMPVKTSVLRNEVREFFAKEVAFHFGAIKSFDPPPDRVNGLITTGQVTWGSFMFVVGAQSDVSGSNVIAGKETPRAVAEMGLYEARSGGKAFSQLYAAEALSHFGTDLGKNPVWQSMNDAEHKEWASLLDATRIYDAKKREPINLPQNYLGVAARIAAYAYEFGILKDRAFLDSLLDRAALQFTSGALFADDDRPNGRYDRYSNEYIRFCWKAAEVAGRKDILEKLKPSMRVQMQLWWDLVSDEGYGYNWGRSQGLVSYCDTMEIAAFLGENPEFRPAPLADIASLYNLAWRWIRAGYLDKEHKFNIFAYGRGNYSYISLDREFQQIGTSFGKIIVAHDSFMKTLEHEGITEIPAHPHLPEVARFQYFSESPDRPEGVWLVRQGDLRFALPITVGTKPGVSDYLAAPFGLTGFANPVEEVYPSLVPFVEMDDGKTYVASEGASEIYPSKDGRSLRVIWKKWGRVGSKSGEREDIRITSDVTWQISGDTLTRTETLIADRDVKIRHWWVAVPSTGDDYRVNITKNGRTDIFTGVDGRLAVSATAGWPLDTSVRAAGDSKLSKGPLRAIQLHLVYSTDGLQLLKDVRASWTLKLQVSRKK